MATPLHQERLEAVVEVLREHRAHSVLDLGCGRGDLLIELLGRFDLGRVLGVDLCPAAVREAERRLAGLGPSARDVAVIEGSFTTPDRQFLSFDAAVLVETIEHLPAHRLSALESTVFGFARPALVIVTTPNSEFNHLLGVPADRRRHPDHKFEWDRGQFSRWAERVARRRGYRVRLDDVGGWHPLYGGSSQMAVFDRSGEGTAEARRQAPLACAREERSA